MSDAIPLLSWQGGNPTWTFPMVPPNGVADEQLLHAIDKARYVGKRRWGILYAVSKDRQTWTELPPSEGPRIGRHRA